MCFLSLEAPNSAHLPGSLPSLFAVAGVFFDPEAYMVPEGENVTLILKTNVTVNKRFRVLVNTVDDSANSKQSSHTAFCCANDVLVCQFVPIMGIT